MGVDLVLRVIPEPTLDEVHRANEAMRAAGFHYEELKRASESSMRSNPYIIYSMLRCFEGVPGRYGRSWPETSRLISVLQEALPNHTILHGSDHIDWDDESEFTPVTQEFLENMWLAWQESET